MRVKMLSELSRTKVVIAREDFSAGELTEKGLRAVLIENKFLMLYIAYQQALVMDNTL